MMIEEWETLIITRYGGVTVVETGRAPSFFLIPSFCSYLFRDVG
jgi:hypothetical protein